MTFAQSKEHSERRMMLRMISERCDHHPGRDSMCATVDICARCKSAIRAVLCDSCQGGGYISRSGKRRSFSSEDIEKCKSCSGSGVLRWEKQP